MTSRARPRITVVGVGADGWPGLPERVRTTIAAAPVVLGGRRHLDLLPDVPGQVREVWPSPLRAGLPALLDRHAGTSPVALASGDPLLSGVATTLIDLLGADAVDVVPAVSSVTLARARLGWAAEDTEVLTLVGRDEALLVRQLAPGRRLLVLSSDASTPDRVAGLLRAHGYAGTRMTVLGDLGSAHETRVEGTAGSWDATVSALHVLALELVGPVVGSWAAGLPDTAYEHDGQLTKRDLRASALARLAPRPGELLWDVGAGAGSVGIEWLRAHGSCRAVALERDPTRAARARANAARLGVPDLEVVEGSAPGALVGLPSPDAVFVGGGASTPGLLERCQEALRPGGRLVVHGVTLETEMVLGAARARHGGELVRLSVETAAPLASFTGWEPARTVTQWSWRRDADQARGRCAE